MISQIITKLKKKKIKSIWQYCSSNSKTTLYSHIYAAIQRLHLLMNWNLFFENEIWFECLALTQFKWTQTEWMSIIFFFLFWFYVYLWLGWSLSYISKMKKKTRLWCVCYSICSFAKDFLLTVVSLLNFSCHIQFSCLLFFIRFSIGISNFTFSQLNELKVCRYQTF